MVMTGKEAIAKADVHLKSEDLRAMQRTLQTMGTGGATLCQDSALILAAVIEVYFIQQRYHKALEEIRDSDPKNCGCSPPCRCDSPEMAEIHVEALQGIAEYALSPEKKPMLESVIDSGYDR